MNEETRCAGEQEKPNEHATPASCSAKIASLCAPGVNTIPASAHQPQLTMNTPMSIESFENCSQDARQDTTETVQKHYQEIKECKTEVNTQLHDFSNMKSQNSFQGPGNQTKRNNLEPAVVGDLSSSGNLDDCCKEISRETGGNSVPLATARSLPVPILQMNIINIASPSHLDHQLLSEGIPWQYSLRKQDGFDHDISAQDITAQSKAIPQAIPQSGVVPVLQLNRTGVAPPSRRDPGIGSEVFSREDSVTKQDGFSQEVSGHDIPAEDIPLSPMSPSVSHISHGANDCAQICDTSVENPQACLQSIRPNKGTTFTKTVDIEDAHFTNVSTQIITELKKQEENHQKLLSTAGLNTDRRLHTDTTSVFDGLNHHEQMDEIDLNEDNVEPEVKKINSVPSVPQQLHIDLSKYTKVLGQHKAAVTVLKQNLVKGVITGRNKLKDVVIEKLQVVSKSPETPKPHIMAADADTFPPYLPGPNNPATAPSGVSQRGATNNPATAPPGVSQGGATNNPATAPSGVSQGGATNNPATAPSGVSQGGTTPGFFPLGSNNMHEQMLQQISPAVAGSVTNVASVMKRDNFAQPADSSSLTYTSLNPLTPTAPVMYPQLNRFNIPVHASPGRRAPILPPAIPQIPAHIRRHAFYPPPYGYPTPPSLPPPPPVPAMEYFANRYCARGHSTPVSAPVIGISPPNIDRAQFSEMEERRSPIVRQANYVTSLFHSKSNQLKNSLQRKISTSLSQTVREDPDADWFMEEGRLKRSSIISGGDQFSRHGPHLLTADDVLMGALCCCCWPLGLAARLVTLMLPSSNGPVDSCIRSMSDQMTRIPLVLGIASYLVFFVLWLSLFIVAAK